MVYDKPFNSSLMLKMLVAAMIASLLIAMPQAQAQGASTPGGQCIMPPAGQICLDKTANPNPVNLGQPLTFTITITNQTNIGVAVEDVLPASVNFESASANCFNPPPPGTPGGSVLCFPSGGTDTMTISVTATQCGSFTNTATSPAGLSASTGFTVEGCPLPPLPKTGEHHHHNHRHKHQAKHHKHHGGGISNTVSSVENG